MNGFYAQMVAETKKNLAGEKEKREQKKQVQASRNPVRIKSEGRAEQDGSKRLRLALYMPHYSTEAMLESFDSLRGLNTKERSQIVKKEGERCGKH